jgi:hypothetical protein
MSHKATVRTTDWLRRTSFRAAGSDSADFVGVLTYLRLTAFGLASASFRLNSVRFQVSLRGAPGPTSPLPGTAQALAYRFPYSKGTNKTKRAAPESGPFLLSTKSVKSTHPHETKFGAANPWF